MTANEYLDINQAKQLLRETGRALVFVTVLNSAGTEVMSIKNTAQSILDTHYSYIDAPLLVDGHYTIEKLGENNDDINYEQHVLAITFNAQMRNSELGLGIGNMPNFINKLSDYDCINRIGNSSNCSGLVSRLIMDIIESNDGLVEDNDYPAGIVWVGIPADPFQKKKLLTILEDNAVFYALPNGEGTIDRNNLSKGNGLSKIHQS